MPHQVLKSVTKSESLIQAALERLMEGRTVVAIAHLDRVIVLRQGAVIAVIEEGAHSLLLSRDGPYAGLWRQQHYGRSLS